MKTLVYRDAEGVVVNIGEWDLGIQQDKEPIYAPHEYIEVDGEKRRSPKPREVVGWHVVAEHITNPIPEGVTSAEEEVATRDDGGLAAVTDHVSLRRSAYPSIADQLDALWKGGAQAEEMRAHVLGVKTRFPKTGR